jgi:hypothetical protein
VLINELIVPAPAWGAALPGARVPWLTVEPSVAGHGRTYALTSSLGYAVLPALPLLADGATDVAGVLGANGAAGTNGIVTTKARPQAAANGLPTNNMKQFVQMKTRVNVDGDGARGPEPEREQA